MMGNNAGQQLLKIKRRWTLEYIFLLTIILAWACKKESNRACCGIPPPLVYEVIGKNGKSILDTNNAPSDSLTLSQFGIRSSDPIITLNILKPGAVPAAYLQAYKQYNETYVTDYAMLQGGSGGVASNFVLSYHGKTLGTICFKPLRWNLSASASWEEAAVFTFNGVPVKMDTTCGKHLYVIQLEQ